MTKEKLQAILDKLPAGTLIYVRQGDDAYPAHLRRFNESRPAVLYLDIVGEDESGDHRNFPEGYSGTREVAIKGYGRPAAAAAEE
jgi:hypothetical protein